MPTAYHVVRRKRNAPKRRRRNSLTLARGRRAPAGRMWVTRRGKTAIPGGFIGQGATRLNPRRRKRRKARARASNPRRRRRSVLTLRRKRRNPRRRRSVARRSNPRRRRRSVARRSNPRRRRRNVFGRVRRHRRRRNPIFRVRRHRSRRRRNPGFSPRGILSNLRQIFTIETGTQVVAGTAGLSVALWGPKLLGFYVKPQLGRGWGGVASSVVSVSVVSSLVSMVSPRAGRAMLAGGLIGAFAGALSALSCKTRMQALPFETALLACALPTTPKQTMAPEAIAALKAAAAAGNPQAQAQLKAAGMSGLSADINQIIAGENAFRQGADSPFRNALGLSDFVGSNQQFGSFGQFGMRDYTQFTGAPSEQNPASLASASTNETF